MDYERSLVWNRAMRLAENVCRLLTALPREERFGMRSQLSRAAVSVPSNIAEGWKRESAKEKLQFFAIAHGSLAELNTQLLLCRRLGWLPHEGADSAIILADDVGRMLTSLKKVWRQRTAKGCTTTHDERPTANPY
jgi:four helix bundle protein